MKSSTSRASSDALSLIGCLAPSSGDWHPILRMDRRDAVCFFPKMEKSLATEGFPRTASPEESSDPMAAGARCETYFSFLAFVKEISFAGFLQDTLFQ